MLYRLAVAPYRWAGPREGDEAEMKAAEVYRARRVLREVSLASCTAVTCLWPKASSRIVFKVISHDTSASARP
jgi:hypothetical protein